MAFNRDASGVQKLSGYVQLHMPISESGPFRAYVQKLFVSPDFRRLGIASKMMYKLEELALARGRWNIVSGGKHLLLYLVVSAKWRLQHVICLSCAREASA